MCFSQTNPAFLSPESFRALCLRQRDPPRPSGALFQLVFGLHRLCSAGCRLPLRFGSWLAGNSERMLRMATQRRGGTSYRVCVAAEVVAVSSLDRSRPARHPHRLASARRCGRSYPRTPFIPTCPPLIGRLLTPEQVSQAATHRAAFVPLGGPTP